MMYTYDQNAALTYELALFHWAAVTTAYYSGREYSLIPTAAEREEIAASWNPPYRYNGD